MQKRIDMTGVLLETDRLVLRAWEQDDLNDLYAYASVPGVGEKAGWKHHESLEESQRILEMFIAGKHTFALVDKETRRIIGSLGLDNGTYLAKEEDKDLFGCEVGYVLAKEYWGKGLMTEAVRRVLRYCLEDLRMDYVICCHFLENDPSRRVIEKCGFEYCRMISYETQLGENKTSRLYVIRKK